MLESSDTVGRSYVVIRKNRESPVRVGLPGSRGSESPS